jgi:hypothetical protein
MAVDPDSLTMAPLPTSWPPGVIGVACVVTRAVNVIRPIANRDRYRARITAVVGSAAIIGPAAIIGSSSIIGSIAWVRAVIPFTAYRAQHGET